MQVVSGFGRMLVTSVGGNSQSGAIAELIARGRGAVAFSSTTTSAGSTTAASSSSSGGSSSSTLEGSGSSKGAGALARTGSQLAEQQQAREPRAADARSGGGLREETLLQQKLARYATVIGELGLAAAMVAWTAMTARFS